MDLFQPTPGSPGYYPEPDSQAEADWGRFFRPRGVERARSHDATLFDRGEPVRTKLRASDVRSALSLLGYFADDVELARRVRDPDALRSLVLRRLWHRVAIWTANVLAFDVGPHVDPDVLFRAHETLRRAAGASPRASIWRQPLSPLLLQHRAADERLVADILQSGAGDWWGGAGFWTMIFRDFAHLPRVQEAVFSSQRTVPIVEPLLGRLDEGRKLWALSLLAKNSPEALARLVAENALPLDPLVTPVDGEPEEQSRWRRRLVAEMVGSGLRDLRRQGLRYAALLEWPPGEERGPQR